MTTIKIMLVEDHPVVRQGVKSLLSHDTDIDIVAEADTLQSALEQLTSVTPHIILLDLRLGKEHGINVARYVKQKGVKCRIIVLTTYDEEDDIWSALEAGAFAYLLKDISLGELPEVIRRVYAGKRYLSPDLMDQVLRDIQHRLNDAQSDFVANFADEECMLLSYMADGMTNREIAEKLSYSEITVKKRVQDLLNKMNVANRTQAVALAIRRSLI
ncbi:MAG TPA: response regulator transcription factor [Caldilineaceae bacterium]|nr:response regulator transcription factor [Caldilineaceae bacterium]